MKRFSIYLSLLLAVLLAGCQNSSEEATASEAANRVPAMQVSAAISDNSIYHQDADWVTQNGQEIKLQTLKGKPVLVSMIYTSCAFACPRTVADIQIIEKGLPGYTPEDFQIVLVTIDPARDTTARLQAFAAENNLDPKRWTLLTNETENIQELAALLNVKYRKALNGEFAHSNLITVLNQEGEIVHQQQGLGASPDKTIEVMKGLLTPQ